MKIRLLILFLTLPLLVFGNSAVTVVGVNAPVAIEMSCCSQENHSENCCCDHSDSHELPCNTGDCTSNGCFLSLQHNFFSEETADFSILTVGYSREKILSSPSFMLSSAYNAIWIPPKINLK